MLRSILHEEWKVKYNNSNHHSSIQDSKFSIKNSNSNCNSNYESNTSNFCLNKEIETLILSTDRNDEERFIRIFRDDTICRRLKSLAARPSSCSRHHVVILASRVLEPFFSISFIIIVITMYHFIIIAIIMMKMI